jgi:hypothetical protein
MTLNCHQLDGWKEEKNVLYFKNLSAERMGTFAN